MYEMTTGQLPYDGDTPVVVAVKHLQELVKAPITINENVSEDVNKVILKAMAKSVDERYQNATDLKSDIEAIMQGKELSKEFDITLDFINNK
jgi:serine/threonine protein kinase